MKKRGLIVLAAGVIGAAATLALPANPAVGTHSPPGVFHDVEVGEPVTLVAKGAAVSVPIEATCGPDAGFATVSVQVSQSRGRHIATGFGSLGGGPFGGQTIVCDGTPQEVTVLITPQSGAFKQGEALVQATLSVCPLFPGPCNQDVDVEVVQITR